MQLEGKGIVEEAEEVFGLDLETRSEQRKVTQCSGEPCLWTLDPEEKETQVSRIIQKKIQTKYLLILINAKQPAGL